MTRTEMNRVRGQSIRVALVAAAVVAAVYLVISAAVVLLTTRELTMEIDQRLAGQLTFIANQPAPRDPIRAGGPPGGPRFAAPLLVWQIASDGTVTSNDASALLPDVARNATTPQTITIGGTEVRVRGADVADHHVVVGQTMEPVTRAQSSIVLQELGIAPILLLFVFLGAVAIGQRVAAPIERARQRQQDFTADASHELRTPLSVIEAQTSLALSQERTAEWYQTAFRRIESESARMRKLIEDLLWLARFDATRGQPDAEPVDLAVLAAQTVDRFGSVAEARHLTLEMRSDAGSHVVTAPPEWLDRLVGVLVDNATKYAGTGGRVAVSVAGEGARIALAVDDSGPGIPSAERERIFDRFHRATDSAGGSGLGLAIADAIVKATNGRWKIGTSPAGGASMSVSWQRALPSEPEPVSSRTASTTQRS